MTRSWRSHIADEVRTASMMNPKEPFSADAQAEIAHLQAENARLREDLASAREGRDYADWRGEF